MKKLIFTLVTLAIAAVPAQSAKRKASGAVIAAPAPVQAEPKDYPTPGEIVTKAEAKEWVAIAPSDLLVMDLAADSKGKPRRVVIQLMPAPFSQGWVGNIRTLAAAKFWDGTSVNRVQDNYVVQWGDATEKKGLPQSLVKVGEDQYAVLSESAQDMTASVMAFNQANGSTDGSAAGGAVDAALRAVVSAGHVPPGEERKQPFDSYGLFAGVANGWPLATNTREIWPVHCYAMVGVGRNLSPDTGTGAELYTVIGHAPRHLDRNIALVGRVIEGIEHLSSLPRGTGALGFYEKAEERVPILSVRIASEMVSDKSQPSFEYLSTESESFAKYADARANRHDAFFIKPAGGADICNIPVPVRRKIK